LRHHLQSEGILGKAGVNKTTKADPCNMVCCLPSWVGSCSVKRSKIARPAGMPESTDENVFITAEFGPRI
jgi:hypothetical protein